MATGELNIAQLATSAISLTDFLAKADESGLATKTTIQSLSNFLSTTNDLSFKGGLAIADTPVVGWYFAEESGTYTNVNSIVVDVTDTLTILVVADPITNSQKVEIPISGITTQPIVSGNTGLAVSGDVADAIAVETDARKKTTQKDIQTDCNLVATLNNGGIATNGDYTALSPDWKMFVYEINSDADLLRIITGVKNWVGKDLRTYAFYTGIPTVTVGSGAGLFISGSDSLQAIRTIDLLVEKPLTATHIAISREKTYAYNVYQNGVNEVEEAIAIASADATSKANTAETNANTYTDTKKTEAVSESNAYTDSLVSATNEETLEPTTTFFNALIQEDGDIFDEASNWGTKLYAVSEFDTIDIDTQVTYSTGCRLYAFYSAAPSKNNTTGSSLFISGGNFESLARAIDLTDVAIPITANFIAVTYNTGLSKPILIGKSDNRVTIDSEKLILGKKIYDFGQDIKEEIVQTNNIIIQELDSLTAGAISSNWRKYFNNDFQNQYPIKEIGYQGFTNNDAAELGVTFGKSGGWIEMINESDFSLSPIKYSLNGKGLFQVVCDNDFIDWNPLVGFWDFCDVYYLQQPTGGTFRVRNASSSVFTQIDTEGDFEVKKVTILKDSGQNNRLSIYNCYGNIAVYGARFRKNGINNSSVINSATGGMTMLKFSQLDPLTIQYWFSELKPSHIMINAGMNDRNTSDSATFKTMLKNRINNIRIGSPYTTIYLISPNESSDYATSNLPSYETVRDEIASELRDIIHVKIPTDFGNYTELLSNGFMGDGVHPNDKFNRLLAPYHLTNLGVDIHKNKTPKPKLITQSTYTLKSIDRHFNLIFSASIVTLTIPTGLLLDANFKGYFTGTTSLTIVGSGTTIIGDSVKNQNEKFEIVQTNSTEYLVI